jgi:hypothetical protein
MVSEGVVALVVTVPGAVRASGPLIAFSGTFTAILRSPLVRTFTDTSSDLPRAPTKVTLVTPESPDPISRTVPPCRARPRLAHDFTQATRVIFGVGVKLTPPLPAAAGEAHTAPVTPASATPFAILPAVENGSGRAPLSFVGLRG